ncbi:dipeptidyl aminopeptidase/acylaminoacyl peptidase [Luteibacter sp. HA06]
MPAFAPEDIYELRDLTSLGGSCAHDLCTWVVSQAKAGADKYESVVWAARGTAPARPITSRESTASSPVLDPKGEILAFLSSRGKGKQVFLLSVAGGEARSCGHLKHVPKSVEGWSPDGARLLLLLSVPWAEDELDDVEAEHRPVVARFLPYKLDGSGPVVGERSHLAVLDTASGAVQILVGGDVDVREASFSPDGRRIAYVRARAGRQRHLRDLYVASADGSSERQLTHGLATVLGLSWSPDSQLLAVTGSETEGEALKHLFLVDVARGGHRPAMKGDVEVAAAGCIWASGGDQLAVVVEHRGRASVALVDCGTGDHALVHPALQQVTAITAQRDRLVFVRATMRQPAEVYSCRWDGSDLRRQSEFNSWFKTRTRPRVSMRRMRVPDGAGGDESIDVWLLKPPTGHGPWPTLVYMHGGPESVVPIEHDRQMYWFSLCEQGWMIVAPNAVGSSSYGSAFAQRLRGHWGERDLPQYLAVIDSLCLEGLVGSRVGCAGKSYGGFLAAWALGKTERFTAGIVSAPVANVLSHQGTSDTGFYVTPYAVNAEATEDLEAYRRLSPLLTFEKLKAPTLFLQGEKDARCPLGQSEELFSRAIRESTADVTLVVYPGGDHSMSSSGRPSHRVDYNRRCTHWLLTRA